VSDLESEDVGNPAAEDVPVPGSTVSLLSASGEVKALTELLSWSTSPSGITATAVLATAPETAELLDGTPVWASLFTGLTDTLLVVQGVVHRAQTDRRGELVLTGITGIAREPRRVEPRAPVSRPVRLGAERSRTVAGHTVDLSPSGCRLALPTVADLQVDEVVTVEVDLDERTVVRAAGKVSRIDRRQRQPVLRFLGLTPTDEGAIGRCVYAALGSGTGGQGPVGGDQPTSA
jgi:hypothetical protein